MTESESANQPEPAEPEPAPKPDPARLLTTAELAERLRITPVTASRLLASNKLRGALQVGGRWRVPAASVDEFIRTQQRLVGR